MYPNCYFLSVPDESLTKLTLDEKFIWAMSSKNKKASQISNIFLVLTPPINFLPAPE